MKPTRCIDPVVKFCQVCKYGQVTYPEWVETTADLTCSGFEVVCILGFDKGRPEDEPTQEEIDEFNEWHNKNIV